MVVMTLANFGGDWEEDAENGWEEVMQGGGPEGGGDISFSDMDSVLGPIDLGARGDKGKETEKGSRIVNWSEKVVNEIVKD